MADRGSASAAVGAVGNARPAPARVREYVRQEAERYGVAAEAIYGRSRLQVVADARITVMQRLRADGFSYPQIGDWMGRDHTTVVEACRNRKVEMRRPPALEQPEHWRVDAVAQLMADGIDQDEIAARLHVSRNTVTQCIACIVAQLGWQAS